MNFDYEKCRIFETLSGSQVYGTNTPESDMDYRGVIISPRSVVFSAFLNFEQHEQNNPDRVLWDLRKYFRLAANCNPSILELLFIPSRFWVMESKYWNRVIENRHLFLSKRARHAFSGYAVAQLKRMRTHKHWMDSAPPKPEPEQFGLTHSMLLGKDEIGAYNWLKDQGINFDKEIVELMSKVKAYHNKLREWKNYQEWRENRNKKRAALEEKYQYDTKHAYHLVRLTRLGKEILETGHMTLTDREDQEELRAIRFGEWTYEKVLEFAESIDKEMDEAEKKTSLPKSPDIDRLDKLCVSIMEEYWEDRKEG